MTELARLLTGHLAAAHHTSATHHTSAVASPPPAVTPLAVPKSRTGWIVAAAMAIILDTLGVLAVAVSALAHRVRHRG